MWLAHPLVWLNATALVLVVIFAALLHGGSMYTRFREWLSRWQEPVVWLPVTLLIVLIAFYLIPAIDPTAGIDGWGDVWGMFVTALAVMIAGFLSWLLQSTYGLELNDKDDRELIDHAAGIVRNPDGTRLGIGATSWPAFAVWAFDKLLWLAVFCIVLYSLRH